MKRFKISSLKNMESPKKSKPQQKLYLAMNYVVTKDSIQLVTIASKKKK